MKMVRTKAVRTLREKLNPRIRNIESEIPDAVPEGVESDLPGDGEVEIAPAE